MSAAQLPNKSLPGTNGRLPDATVLERVRQALVDADEAGERRPGRPTLMRISQGTGHQVRNAMAALEQEAKASEHQRPRPPSAWPLGFIGLAAAVAVWGGWVDLGRFTGFGMVQPLPGLADDFRINTAIVLPIGIEAYGGYALRTWLSSAELSRRTRSYAGWSALASLTIGGGAQVASHLMKAHDIIVAPWWVTVVVSCIPVAVLGWATGLATLVRQDTTNLTALATSPNPSSTSVAGHQDLDSTKPQAHDRNHHNHSPHWWSMLRPRRR